MKYWLQRTGDALQAMARGLSDGLREIWNLGLVIVGWLDPRQVPRLIRRDTGAMIDSSKLVAAATTAAATDVATQAALSPMRLARWLIHAPGRLWVFLITRSPMQLLIGSVVMAVGITVVVWPMARVFRERRLQSLALEQHRQMDEHYARADAKGVMHNIDVLLKVNPDDDKMLARKKALETGKSPPNDLKTARLLMRQHWGNVNLAEATREAKLVMGMDKTDWEATLIVADSELRSGNRAAAAKLVKALPRAHETRDPISLWSASLAVRTFRSLNEQWRLDDMIGYLSEFYVPLVNRIIATQVEPAGQLQLVEIYNLCMTTLADRPELQRYWAPVQEMCHSIANSPESTAPILIGLGVLQEIQREVYLRQLLQLRLINAEKQADYLQEIDQRLKTIWRRVRELEPKHYLSYLGPAMQLARANDLKAAHAEIEAGIAACGQLPELIEKKAEVMRRLDPAGGLAFLEQALSDAQLSKEMCKVIADAALAANRPDKALQAAQKAQALQPQLPWAVRLEAQIHMDAGRPADAAAVLSKADIVIDDPAIGSLYVRALAASGATVGAEQFLLRAMQLPQTRGIVVGGAEALARLGQEEIAINVVKKLIIEEPMNTIAYVVLGDSYKLLAERQERGWNKQMVDEALKAYRLALFHDKRQFRVIQNIAWLELVALDLPKLAHDTAKPLREAQANLPPDMLEIVGATCVGVGEYENGRAALEKAVNRGGGKATTLAFLALAYNGLNRTETAQQTINRAANTAKNGPREGELVESIRRKIERGGR